MDAMGNLRCWPPGHGLAVRIDLQNWESLVTPESLRKVREFRVIRGQVDKLLRGYPPGDWHMPGEKMDKNHEHTTGWGCARSLRGQTFTRQFV